MEIDRKGKRPNGKEPVKKAFPKNNFDIDGPIADIQLGKSISEKVNSTKNKNIG